MKADPISDWVASIGAFDALGLWLGLHRHPAEWPSESIALAAVRAGRGAAFTQT